MSTYFKNNDRSYPVVLGVPIQDDPIFVDKTMDLLTTGDLEQIHETVTVDIRPPAALP